MMRILVTSSFALFLVGCTARPIDFADGGEVSGDDDTATATATTTGSPTPDPGTTGPSTTGPSTTGPSTTGPVTTTGPDPSATGPILDLLPPDPWPDIPLDACAEDWGPGTWITGLAPWGEFAGNRAWNAMVNPWQPGRLKVVILGKDADVAANLKEAAQNGGMPETGPAIVLDTPFPYPEWLETAEVPALLIEDGLVDFALVRIDVFERHGNWDTWIPDDPPRVRGNLAWVEGEPWGFEGQFDAAYCGYFHEVVIAE